MRVPAQEMAERAAAWAGSESAVRAAVVYGSVWALGRWAEHTGRPRPRNPLVPAIAARLGVSRE